MQIGHNASSHSLCRAAIFASAVGILNKLLSAFGIFNKLVQGSLKPAIQFNLLELPRDASERNPGISSSPAAGSSSRATNDCGAALLYSRDGWGSAMAANSRGVGVHGERTGDFLNLLLLRHKLRRDMGYLS